MCSMFLPRSSMSTVRPFSVSSFAAQPPEMPDPTTIASYVVLCTLEVPPGELPYGEVRCSGGESHVRQRRIYARRRGHTRAVGDEDVRCVPHLIVRVEHRVLRTRTHARGAHLVNPHAGVIAAVVCMHVLDAGLLDHR